MERAHIRTRQLLPLQRGFERSRLENQLIVTAYELVVPVRRAVLPSPQHYEAEEAWQNPPAPARGGLSA